MNDSRRYRKFRKFVNLTVFLTGLDKHCIRRGTPSHLVITAAFAGSEEIKNNINADPTGFRLNRLQVGLVRKQFFVYFLKQQYKDNNLKMVGFI